MRAIVSLSGGMDSTTVLALSILQGRQVTAVGFKYGSKHNPYENRAAREVADYYHVPFRLLDLSEAMRGFSSSLMVEGGEIPEGHYQEGTMKQTVVPGRNLIFASMLTGVAWTIGAEEVWMGLHAGDHAVYPDCRPSFFSAMKEAVEQGSDHKVTLMAPFLFDDKSCILSCGLKMVVPYHLTRTCYKAQEKACGKCGACRERLESFQRCGVEDPILYEGEGDG